MSPNLQGLRRGGAVPVLHLSLGRGSLFDASIPSRSGGKANAFASPHKSPDL